MSYHYIDILAWDIFQLQLWDQDLLYVDFDILSGLARYPEPFALCFFICGKVGNY